MIGYSVKVVECTKDLTAKERVKIKDTTNAIKLDEATQGGAIVIAYDYHAVLAIHNEKLDDPDYRQYVVVDTAGNKYVTGSESFFTAMTEIVDEMSAAGETDYELEVYRMDSKNYKGKQFITCSIV
jgi:hypothetical protein